jgi:hypothetical protein
MKKLTPMLAMLAAILMPVLFASPASAQATRTWISGVGDDVNPCSRTAPCKTFAGAISKTASGGEIDTLDPGGFGGVTVTKAMTLADEGVGEAGILVAGTNGITVNCATDPNCVVVVRGLVIDGGPIGSNSLNGVRFVAGRSLIVENTTIRNFTGGSPNGNGISFNPSSGGAETLIVDNCSITTNGVNGGVNNTTGGGIFIQPTGSAVVNAVIRNSHVSNNNGYGIRLDASLVSSPGAIHATVSNTDTSGNGSVGMAAITMASGGQPSVLNIDHSTLSSNNVGLNGNGSAAIVRIGTSTIMNNATGVKQVSSSIMSSYGTNQISENATPGTTLLIVGPT